MKKTTSNLLLILFFFFTQVLFAQIHVDENGSVGIGTDTPGTTSKLKITSDGIDYSATENHYIEFIYTAGTSTSLNHTGLWVENVQYGGKGIGGYFLGGLYGITGRAIESGTSGSRIGVHGYAGNSTYKNYGLYGKAIGGEGSLVYGVYAEASGSGSEGYGIYATASSGISTHYAAKFNGGVHIIGSISYGSDEKLKDNIMELESSLTKIKQLKPKSYKFKKDKELHFSEGKHYGLTAQDLEKIYPELVTEVLHTVGISPELEEKSGEVFERETITYKAINYNELIPILLKGMQEQQEMIEDLQKRVEQLEKK